MTQFQDSATLNREYQSQAERIDFRTTEIELLENEVNYLRQKLDRLIKAFDFKIFAKIGQIKNFKRRFSAGPNDEDDEVNPASFQHFCQLLLKIHGVNSSPKTSEAFLKSLNISHEIKHMRITIDRRQYQLEDLEKSLGQYIKEQSSSKKGSLEEFLDVSVTYACKTARHVAWWEELEKM